MKVRRKIIEIDESLCDGCGNCVLSCAEGAIQVVDGKARVMADKFCDGLGACLGECPRGALKIVEREADEFDDAAVAAYLSRQATGNPFPMADPAAIECHCGDEARLIQSNGRSALGHWPVQINLVPVGAPFLTGADLLIAADCVPVAYPSFHADFLAGRAVMIGCPKFDDAAGYVDKLAQVFAQSGVRRITIVIMEVPCCSGLPMIVRKALEKSGVDIPCEEIVISARGERVS